MAVQDQESMPPLSLQDARRYVEARETEEEGKASTAENPYVARVHRQLARLYRVRREMLGNDPASARELR